MARHISIFVSYIKFALYTRLPFPRYCVSFETIKLLFNYRTIAVVSMGKKVGSGIVTFVVTLVSLFLIKYLCLFAGNFHRFDSLVKNPFISFRK